VAWEGEGNSGEGSEGEGQGGGGEGDGQRFLGKERYLLGISEEDNRASYQNNKRNRFGSQGLRKGKRPGKHYAKRGEGEKKMTKWNMTLSTNRGANKKVA